MAGREEGLWLQQKEPKVGRVREVRVGVWGTEVQNQRAARDRKSKVQAAVWIREMGTRLEEWGKGENEGTVGWKSGNPGGVEGWGVFVLEILKGRESRAAGVGLCRSGWDPPVRGAGLHRVL